MQSNLWWVRLDGEAIFAPASILTAAILVPIRSIQSALADDGFEIVSEADYDVLLIRTAIIDLDITAPDNMSAGRTRTYTANSGAATLYIELFDSVSGQIVGRAADRQAARHANSMMTWTTRASNTADARRVFRSWTTKLRGFLDSHYVAK